MLRSLDNFTFVSHVFALMVVSLLSLSTAAEPEQIRVLTYNIHHGRGMDNRVDLERIAKVITDSRADLVALQEVDHKTRRTDGVDQTSALAKLTGLHGHFAKAIDFEGGEYGQALLSRWPITNVEIELLPGEPDRERRIIAVGNVEFAGKPLKFGSTHLHHADASFRLRQAQTINSKFASDSVEEASRIVIAGDLNAPPDSAPLVELAKHWRVAKPMDKQDRPLLTFPATAPKSQIDYVLYRPASRFNVLSIEVINEPMASDHRPVLVVLSIIP